MKSTIRVRIEKGLITGRAPAGVPDGEVDVRLVDPADEFSDDELAYLDEVFAQGVVDIKAGRGRPAADVLADLSRVR